MARSEGNGKGCNGSGEVPPLPQLPTVDTLEDARMAGAHPGIMLPRLLALARERQEWLSDRLAEQVAAEGLAGLVDATRAVTPDGGVVETGEYLRGLAQWESAERDRAAALGERIARLGLDEGQVLRDVASWITSALETLTGELGFSLRDEPVLRSARRAALVARRNAGHDDGDPDVLIGPRLSPEERVVVLEAALERARVEVGAELAAMEVARLPGRSGPHLTDE